MKRGRENDSDEENEEIDSDDGPPAKKPKLDINQLKQKYSLNDAKCKFCKTRPVAPGKTQRGNPFDTCCRDCATKKGKAIYHSGECNDRFYEYSLGTEQITPLETYDDLNVRIENKYKKEFESVIKDNLPSDMPDAIKKVIFDYTAPNKIESKPYWTPAFLESSYEKEQIEKDSFKYLTFSKYGGLPYLSIKEEWPKCKGCENGMCFYFQLNVDTMPDEYKQKYLVNSDFYKGHLLQLFYCNNDMCDGYEPFSDASLARMIKIERYNEESKTKESENDRKEEKKKEEESKTDGFRSIDYLESKRKEFKSGWDEFDYKIDCKSEYLINDWLKCNDDKWEGPHWEDASDVIINMPNFLSSFDDETLGIGTYGFTDENNPTESDKLGGWPCFIQGAEYPTCPKCMKFLKTGKEESTDNDKNKDKDNCNENEEEEDIDIEQDIEKEALMNDYIFQFDGMKIDQMFGDCGIGHITVCNKHPYTLAFGWACS